MSCRPPVIVYQVGANPATTAGVFFLIARCTAGRMKVHEITIQNQTVAVTTGLLQFFVGNGTGFPLSLPTLLQQFQMWSKPGGIVSDDIYCVDTIGGVALSWEARTESLEAEPSEQV